MTACPSPELLAALINDDLEADSAETLVDHLSQCETCREALLKLSVDPDEWRGWESLLQAQHLSWPTTDGQSPTATDVGGEHGPSTSRDTTHLADTYVQEAGPALSPGFTAPASGKQSPQEFGDYQLLEKLGAGGMGIVYRARQKSAGRLVALKLIRPELLQSLSEERRQAWVDRFRVEAQSTARLDHDNVVTIYEVGEYQGTLYYSMQYIEGQSLAQLVRDGPMENRLAARLMRGVALAVDCAHRQGILHRDLKPQNILIRRSQLDADSIPEGSDSALSPSAFSRGSDERPFVADFGLAKCLEEGASGSTHTGEVMGSPSYMSPEQAQDASRCTPSSDIYSLGATLYETLTGRPPFRAHSALETLRQVIDQEPVAPRDLNPAISLDLQTITLKALAKEPFRRYATAAEFADDLQRFILGDPIAARPIGPLERMSRWCRRNPAVALLTAGVATLLFVVAFGSVAYSIRVSQHATSESVARTEAESYLRVTLNVIDDMVTEFGDESLAHVPQMEHVRKDLLRKALGLHQRLLAMKPSSFAVRVELARVQQRIGNLHELLGERDEAQAAYAESIRLFDELRRIRPADHRLRHFLATSHTMLGETLRKMSPADARRSYEEALAIQKGLQQAVPGNLEYEMELGRTLNNLGLVLTETGQHTSAEPVLREAIEHLQKLSRKSNGSPQVLADLGRSQINLGVLLRKIPDRASQAEAAYRDAIENLEQAVKLDPENRDCKLRLAVALVDLGNYFLTEVDGRADKALELTTDANTQFQVLRENFPGIPLYRYELANSHSSLAIALAMLERPDDARGHFNDAHDALAELGNDFPDYVETVPEYHSLKGRVLGGLGYLDSLAENLDEARKSIEQAIECQREATRLAPENPEFTDFLSQHHAFLATILTKLDLPEEADAAKQTAQALATQAAEMKAGNSTSDDHP